MQPSEESSLRGYQGLRIEFADPQQRAEAIEHAFDYRGDITIATSDGRSIEGYIFDRRKDGPEHYIRLMLSGDGRIVRVNYADITTLAFSGRDTAAGKSWETWVKKYQEKKARGEEATLKPEALDE